MNDAMNCPVCEEADCSRDPWSRKADHSSEYRYNCARCGSFILSCGMMAGQLRKLSPHQRAVLSHRLRRAQRDTPPEILESLLPKVDDPLPSPPEQADSLILWLGDHQPSPAQGIEIPEAEVSAWIGTSIDGLDWLLRQDPLNALVEITSYRPTRLQLTMKGWARREALKHAEVESRKAFMAMKFDEEMDHVVKDYFKPAVARTGFELRTLTDGQPAGLIDDQLRVALRTSRFVIADLTHANNGAYWEAGFAEGLGRPVIYTCREKEWREGKAHFDTNHLNTIIWDPAKLEDAATRLTTTIRASLPAEAKMTD
jgi:nucleoside 2-deoxyribosyltransferase